MSIQWGDSGNVLDGPRTHTVWKFSMYSYLGTAVIMVGGSGVGGTGTGRSVHRDSEGPLLSVWTLASIHDQPPAQSPGRIKEPPRPEGQRQNSWGGAFIDKHYAWRFESVVATKLPLFLVPRVTVKQLSIVTSCSLPLKLIQWKTGSLSGCSPLGGY